MKHLKNQSGQMLLIAIFIGLLVVLAIPVLIFVNQMNGRHQVASRQATMAKTTAFAGISYAAEQLKINWAQALAGNFAYAGSDCNTGNPVITPTGDQFMLQCDQSGRPYEVHVTVTARARNSATINISSRSVEAYLSQRTIGVKMTDGYSASAALLLVNIPRGEQDGNLSVHWGPIVCLSSPTLAAWMLYNPMNSAGQIRSFPRKFSLGGIQGNGSSPGDNFYRAPDWTSAAVTSDQREFWAFSPQTFSPPIDDGAYRNAAGTTNPGTNVSGYLAGDATHTHNVNPVSGGYYSVVGDTLVFDASFQPNSGSIIYVDGNLKLENLSVDLSTGALIVTGNLLLGDTSSGGIPNMILNFPPTAPLEYPYYGPSDNWPCKARVGMSTCTVGTSAAAGLFGLLNVVHFRGFIWAQNNLTVTANSQWDLAGALVVGNPSLQSGVLTLQQPSSSMNLAYDDIVGHQILTSIVELQSDSIRNISVH